MRPCWPSHAVKENHTATPSSWRRVNGVEVMIQQWRRRAAKIGFMHWPRQHESQGPARILQDACNTAFCHLLRETQRLLSRPAVDLGQHAHIREDERFPGSSEVDA